jgi:predicted transcriptional regulator
LKTFTFKLHRSPIKKMMSELRQAARTKVPLIHDDEMLCDSAESMSEAISKSKLSLFAAIVEHKPKSIRELAKIVNKDVANVFRDAKGLELIGLIDMVPDKASGQKTARPVAKFDKILFDLNATRKASSGT